jgi:ankyrin repeat protein
MKHTLRQMKTAPFIHDSRQVLTLSFFFNGRGSELHKSPLGLFRSILFQITRNVPIARDTVTQIFKKKIIVGKPGEAWDWHPKELCEIIASVLPQILEEHSVRLFVDALDECVRTNEADEDQLESFWKLFSDACAVCISHREFPLVNLNSELEVHVDKGNRADIETYVRKKLDPDQDELSDLIIESSHGIFMWTVLVVTKVSQRLREKEDKKTIRSEIRRLPQGLGKLYERLLESIPEEEKHKTLKLVRWICFSREPLSLDQIRFAMAVDANIKVETLEQYRAMPDFTDSNETMKSRVERYSRGLAELKGDYDRTMRIQFIHQSVSDFFVEIGLQIIDSDCRSKGSAIGRAHLFLSRSCINFIAIEDVQDIDELRDAYESSLFRGRDHTGMTLAIYATKYWTVHAQNAEINNTPADILGPLEWPSQALFERWKRMSQLFYAHSHPRPNEGTAILHTLSTYRLIAPLSIILQSTNEAIFDINILDADGRTSLSWAAAEGHIPIVELLIKQGADLNYHNGTKRSPLSRAAENGHTAIVEYLLKKGADPNHHDETNQTPLSWAAKMGQTAVAELLINKGANLNHLDEYDRTPFWWAVENGHEPVVKRLLADARIDPNKGQVPLVQAVKIGNHTLVEVLLADSRVNSNAVGEERNTPLHSAAEMGHEGIVRLLLTDDRVKPDPRDVFGRTPFSRASGKGHEAVLKLLWATKCIDSDSRDQNNDSPMVWAMIGRNDAVVKWLLSIDTIVPNVVLDLSLYRIKLRPSTDYMPYHARTFHDAVLDMPLQSCVWKENFEDVARIRYEIAIKLLLEKNNRTLDSKYCIDQGLSRYEPEDQDLALLRSFIRNPNLSEYEFENYQARRLVSYAIEYGHLKVVELLIGKDNRWVNSRDRKGRSPLYWGAVKGQKSIRDFLRSRGGTL